MHSMLRRGPGRRAAIVALSVALVTLVALFSLTINPLRTLASLERVDDFPLYVMHYRGAYLFQDYLRRGVERGVYAAIYDSLYTRNFSGGCTTFAALNREGDSVVGRNFDWRHRASLVLFTDPPHAYASVSMVDIHYFGYGDGESSWAERLGLLATPYAIVDGMNEYGVAVSEMAVPWEPARCEGSTEDRQHVAILNNHVMRLVLDHARNVDEALALIADYRLRFPVVCTHHLIADAEGNSAIVEYSAGRMIVTRNADPWLVATNFMVSEPRTAEDPGPCWRYAIASEALAQTRGALTQEEGMAILRSVAQQDTVWSVVYNLVTGEIHLAMGRQYDRVHSFRLSMAER